MKRFNIFLHLKSRKCTKKMLFKSFYYTSLNTLGARCRKFCLKSITRAALHVYFRKAAIRSTRIPAILAS